MDNVLAINIRGDRETLEWFNRNLNRFERTIQEFMTKWAFGTISITKEEYLTDPGRPFRLIRRRDGSVASVPIYPREKIGVITGRLRSSYGAQGSPDGIYSQSRGIHGFTMTIGTNVEYAESLVVRKYDFRWRGAEHFYRSETMTKLVEELGRNIFGEP